MTRKDARKIALLSWASSMVLHDGYDDLPSEDAAKVSEEAAKEGRKILSRFGCDEPFVTTADAVQFVASGKHQ